MTHMTHKEFQATERLAMRLAAERELRRREAGLQSEEERCQPRIVRRFQVEKDKARRLVHTGAQYEVQVGPFYECSTWAASESAQDAINALGQLVDHMFAGQVQYDDGMHFSKPWLFDLSSPSLGDGDCCLVAHRAAKNRNEVIAATYRKGYPPDETWLRQWTGEPVGGVYAHLPMPAAPTDLSKGGDLAEYRPEVEATPPDIEIDLGEEQDRRMALDGGLPGVDPPSFDEDIPWDLRPPDRVEDEWEPVQLEEEEERETPRVEESLAEITICLKAIYQRLSGGAL